MNQDRTGDGIGWYHQPSEIKHLAGNETAEARRPKLLGQQVVEADVVPVGSKAPWDPADRARPHRHGCRKMGPVGVDVVGTPSTRNLRQPHSVGRRHPVGKRPSERPGTVQAPEGAQRWTWVAGDRPDYGRDDAVKVGQDLGTSHKLTDVVVYDWL